MEGACLLLGMDEIFSIKPLYFKPYTKILNLLTIKLSVSLDSASFIQFYLSRQFIS
jgi:hypothetical protein